MHLQLQHQIPLNLWRLCRFHIPLDGYLVAQMWSQKPPFHKTGLRWKNFPSLFHFIVFYMDRVWVRTFYPPPKVFWTLFFNDWKFESHILRTTLVFKSTPNNKVSLNYFSIWWSYAILCTLTQRIFHFRNTFATKHKLLIFDNKQIAEMLQLQKQLNVFKNIF